MAHYLFNFVPEDAAKGPALLEQAARFLRVRMWGVDADEPHRDALASGDLILIYLGAPEREFIGRAELASAVRTDEYRAVRNRPATECQGRFPNGRCSDHR